MYIYIYSVCHVGVRFKRPKGLGRSKTKYYIHHHSSRMSGKDQGKHGLKWHRPNNTIHEGTSNLGACNGYKFSSCKPAVACHLCTPSPHFSCTIFTVPVFAKDTVVVCQCADLGKGNGVGRGPARDLAF